MRVKEKPLRLTAKTINRVVDFLFDRGVRFTFCCCLMLEPSDILPYIRDPYRFLDGSDLDSEEIAGLLAHCKIGREDVVELSEPRHQGDTRVYFIRNATSGHVKVGWSADPDRRLAQLQTASHDHLEVIASIPGGPETEHRIHRLLEPYRVSGEWFRGEDMVHRVITFLAEQHA